MGACVPGQRPPTLAQQVVSVNTVEIRSRRRGTRLRCLWPPIRGAHQCKWL